MWTNFYILETFWIAFVLWMLRSQSASKKLLQIISIWKVMFRQMEILRFWFTEYMWLLVFFDYCEICLTWKAYQGPTNAAHVSPSKVTGCQRYCTWNCWCWLACLVLKHKFINTGYIRQVIWSERIICACQNNYCVDS